MVFPPGAKNIAICDLSDLRRVSGEVRESVVREAFKTLIKDWGRSKNLIFVSGVQAAH
jgi:hypothetical protein